MSRGKGIAGAALLAVLAMGALAVASAQASSFDYQGGTTKEIGVGGEQVFNAGGAEIKCTEVFAETTEFNGNEVKLTPVYPTGKCTAFGFPMHVTVNGQYIVTPNKTVKATGTTVITPTFLGSSVCTVTIAAGTYKANGYDNSSSSPMTNTFTAATENEIPFAENEGGGCGCGSGNGSYTGNAVVEGQNAEGKQTDITWTE